MKPHRKKMYNSFFFLFKFNQCHKIGWNCKGSAGISYLPPVQRIYPSTTKFSPIFTCLFISLFNICFFHTKLHGCTWTFPVHPQTNVPTVEIFCSNPVTSSPFDFKVSCNNLVGWITNFHQMKCNVQKVHFMA